MAEGSREYAMRTQTRTLYTLADLRERFPEAYAKVLRRWEEACDRSGECPWADEALGSARAVVEACGGTLRDYSVGPYSQGYFRVEVEDEDDDGRRKGRDWLRLNVLKPNGYTDKRGRATFPGLCHWTGYCMDDACLESVWQDVCHGATLKEALEGLEDVVRREMEDSCEQMRDEDSMLANWDGTEYTEDGRDA